MGLRKKGLRTGALGLKEEVGGHQKADVGSPLMRKGWGTHVSLSCPRQVQS